MCNPMAVMALQSSSAVLSAGGAYGQAAGQKSLLSYEANMAEINAGLAERSAQTELLRGQFEEQKARLAAAQQKSSQRAQMAGAGIDLGVGSAARVQTSTDLINEIDVNTLHANAVRSAWGYRIEGVNLKNEAALKRATAAGISPGMAAATSLLGSASQVAGSWYGMAKSGALSQGVTGGKTANPYRLSMPMGTN